MEDNPGTILITKTQIEHDLIVAYAKKQGWLLIGLVGNKATYLAQSGHLIQIQLAIPQSEKQGV